MIVINESRTDVIKALEDEDIRCETHGKSMIIVPKKDLDKATKIKNEIDPSITIGSRA